MQKEVLLAQVLEIAETNFSDREYKFINDLIKQKKINTLRLYLESGARSSQRRLLDSIMRNQIDLKEAERYRLYKQLDDKVTYVCQELS